MVWRRWQKQSKLLEHFVAGTTARCASSLIGVNKSTGAYYFHRLREIIAYKLDLESHEVFDGEMKLGKVILAVAEKASVGAVRRVKCQYLGY